jgi:L-2-hydroxyglutarate oxidase
VAWVQCDVPAAPSRDGARPGAGSRLGRVLSDSATTRPRHVVVVGGGIVGLAVARELLQRFPGLDVTVLEKEDVVGAHQTSHNSGVVHAGLYYTPGSLKATLCRAGAERMRAYCAENDLPYDACGKVVVALEERELGRLHDIARRAEANGVPGLARLDAREFKAVEPEGTGIAAVHSPHTAVTDFGAVARSFARDVTAAGGRVLTGAAVTAVEDDGTRVRVRTTLAGSEEVESSDVVVCAGVQSDRLAKLSGQSADPAVVPFRGEYFKLVPQVRDRVRGLIYPVPDPRYPFLGIHLTRTVHGEVLVGPNAVLGLHREAYDRRGVRGQDVRDTFGYPGFWRFARQHWRTGVSEVARSSSRALFVKEARRYLPGLSTADIVPVPAGVRAQALDTRGRLVDDFVLARQGRVTHVRNAPSPAATASLAIAEHIVADVFSR